MRQGAKVFPTKLHEGNGAIFQLRCEDVLVVAYATAPFEYGNTPSRAGDQPTRTIGTQTPHYRQSNLLPDSAHAMPAFSKATK